MNQSMSNVNTQTSPPVLETPRTGLSILTYWLIAILIIVIAVPVYAIGFTPEPELISQTNLPEYQEMGFIPKEIVTVEEEEEREEIAEKTANLSIDRTISLSMFEWGFDQPNINLKTGEVVKFVVTNDGNLPHEWMIMEQEAMEEVQTRLENADFLLNEHEALVEAAIMLPGQQFETVFQAEQPGMYMFMCMYPYHMQLGMMGMIMVGENGMSMDGAMDMEMPSNMEEEQQDEGKMEMDNMKGMDGGN